MRACSKQQRVPLAPSEVHYGSTATDWSENGKTRCYFTLIGYNIMPAVSLAFYIFIRLRKIS